MNMMKRVAAVAMVLGVGVSAALARGATLAPGDAAPPLEVKKWYKGTAVDALAPDKTYVVEFWATWCGPCRESIPHLTELAKKNPDVTFIGVSIWEDDNGENIANFVKQMGDKMDYSVGYAGNQEGMAKTWMAAAGQNGIPTAFIVKEGKIQWVGHPMTMEKPLAQVKAGTFDLKAFKAEFAKQAEAERKQQELQAEVGKIVALYQGGSRAEAKQKLDALVAKNPELKPTAEMIRLNWLSKEDSAAWEKKATELANSKDAADRQALLGFSLRQAQPGQDLEKGRKGIELAVKGTGGKDLLVLEYAEAFYRQTKDYKAALRMIDQMQALVPTVEESHRAELKAAIEREKKDLEEKAKGS